ncbi:MAG TPA: 4-hydroxy-tetrahydrodipicolinate reductase [Actinomycetota bacterium]
MIRVGVVGATGRMGREVCRAVAAAPDLDLVAAVSRSGAGATLAAAIGLEGNAADLTVADRLDALTAARAEVLVDFTGPAFGAEHVAWGIAHGIHVVEGTSGFAIDPSWAEAAVGVIVVPNFAIGAVLMQRFAREAAAWFAAAEVIELHHDGKRDAPSGTALATAEAIAAARRADWEAPLGDDGHPGARGADVAGVRVHSVRLPGLLAHQEVLFGGPGQTLSIRHDSTDRVSFMPGILLAIRRVAERPGLTVGLEPLLG